MTISEFDVALPSATLRVRAAGADDAPVVMLVHGFPEGAFAWDDVLEQLATRGYRAVAPYLRGFGPSAHPPAVEDYRISEVAIDLGALAMTLSPGRPLAAMVAHDWGGAAGWAVAARAPHLLERLVIINSPHPGAFLRDLRTSHQQQAASEYMNALAAADAEQRFAADDYRLLWRFFEGMGATGARGWLTDEVRERYRHLWGQGLTGGLNYYRATPVRPGLPLDDISLPQALYDIAVPTLVIWGTGDTALLPGLLDGLSDWVNDLTVVTDHEATHWIVHEKPDVVTELITNFLTQS